MEEIQTLENIEKVSLGGDGHVEHHNKLAVEINKLQFTTKQIVKELKNINQTNANHDIQARALSDKIDYNFETFRLLLEKFSEVVSKDLEDIKKPKEVYTKKYKGLAQTGDKTEQLLEIYRPETGGQYKLEIVNIEGLRRNKRCKQFKLPKPCIFSGDKRIFCYIEAEDGTGICEYNFEILIYEL